MKTVLFACVHNGVRSSPMIDLPNITHDHLDIPDLEKLGGSTSTHRPRIMLLYGSLRP